MIDEYGRDLPGESYTGFIYTLPNVSLHIYDTQT